MKANAAQIIRALDSADPAYRLFLLHGPDEAASRDLAARLAKKLGANAERVDLASATLKSDPARLADEAASISLFGDPRYIRIDPATDDMIDAVAALLEAPGAGNPAVAIAGNLRKDSKLLKLALASPVMIAFASYPPEGLEADRIAAQMAQEAGMQIPLDLARRLVAATGGDRAIIAREIEKLALYIDAAPDHPHTLDHAAFDAISAAMDESDLSHIVDAVIGGDVARADLELGRLGPTEGITLIRALIRRVNQLLPLRAEVAAGNSIDSVMAGPYGRAIFWKDQKIVASLLARWTPQSLETLVTRLGTAERRLKSSGTAGMVELQEELITIARAAAARRR